MSILLAIGFGAACVSEARDAYMAIERRQWIDAAIALVVACVAAGASVFAAARGFDGW